MTTFFVIGGIGIVLLVVALVVGDILEGALDFDGMFDLDALAGFDSDIFSTAGIAGLLGGFGFGGAIGLALTDIVWAAIAVGLVVGVALGWMAGKLTSLLRKQGSDVAPNTNSLVGAEALVITAVPESGYGQIRVNYQGHTHTLNARSPIPLDADTRVWVSQVLSATSVEVRPTDALPGATAGELEV